MDLGLGGKKIFITGGSSGIGAATARLLAEEGADVLISYCSNRQGAEETAEAVRSKGRKAWLVQMDLSKPESIQEAICLLPEEAEALDGLVMCAGLSLHTDFAEITPEEWKQVMDVNLTGAFFTLQALTPMLNNGAAVVMVSSVSAQTGVAHQAHYAAAKAGLVNLTKSAARALAPKIRVNCVTPGVTMTPMGQETIEALDKDYAKNKMLLQRFAASEEIARALVFLVSPANSFMTGATVDVNGGRDLR